jgi:hypothetical protein
MVFESDIAADGAAGSGAWCVNQPQFAAVSPGNTPALASHPRHRGAAFAQRFTQLYPPHVAR